VLISENRKRGEGSQLEEEGRRFFYEKVLILLAQFKVCIGGRRGGGEIQEKGTNRKGRFTQRRMPCREKVGGENDQN